MGRFKECLASLTILGLVAVVLGGCNSGESDLVAAYTSGYEAGAQMQALGSQADPRCMTLSLELFDAESDQQQVYLQGCKSGADGRPKLSDGAVPGILD